MAKGNDSVSNIFGFAKSLLGVPFDFLMELTGSTTGKDVVDKGWRAFYNMKDTTTKDNVNKFSNIDSAKDLGKATFGQSPNLQTYAFNTEPLRDFNSKISQLLNHSQNKDIQNLVKYQNYLIQPTRRTGNKNIKLASSSGIQTKSRGFLANIG